MNEDLTKSSIVFFGTDAFSVPSLIKLIAQGWNISGVVTKPDSPTGRGRLLTQPAVKRLALSRNIPVLQPTDLSAIAPQLSELKPTVGIVVAYGKILPASIFKVFPRGLINVHPSLLPKYRGSTPIESAILNGDKETGVTLMLLDAELDTGPTYDVAKLQLSGTENRQDLYEHLAEMGADLLDNNLQAILEGRVVALPQNESEAVKVGRIKKSAGKIDWSKSSTLLEREVRGYLGWPGSYTDLNGCNVTITAARADSNLVGPKKPGHPYLTESGELAVSTGFGSLIIDRLKPAGSRDMPARDFISGHPLK